MDFSALNNGILKAKKEPAAVTHQVTVPDELKAQPKALTGAKYADKRAKDTELNLLELGQLLNERLGRAEITISEYNKAVRDDRPPEEVALLAAKALSLAMAEELIYTTIAKKYQDKYDLRLTDEPPFKVIREA